MRSDGVPLWYHGAPRGARSRWRALDHQSLPGLSLALGKVADGMMATE